jgi:small nuclear ribonucleoprotein (snRNP)-like protein
MTDKRKCHPQKNVNDLIANDKSRTNGHGVEHRGQLTGYDDSINLMIDARLRETVDHIVIEILKDCGIDIMVKDNIDDLIIIIKDSIVSSITLVLTDVLEKRINSLKFER